jgi:hypothetical protein
VVEVEVTHQKRSLVSLPPGKCQTMIAITTKTKDIIATWMEQQTITKIAIDAVDKALIFYTQLAVAQLVIAPMIKKMETMDLTTPRVMKTDANEVIQLT